MQSRTIDRYSNKKEGQKKEINIKIKRNKRKEKQKETKGEDW